jgi:hypothetical protein
VANEYATLAELKDRMDITNTDRDVELQGKLTTAARGIEKDCGGRRFWLDPVPVARTFSPAGRVVPTCDGQKLLVDDIGVDVLVVEVGSGSSWTAVTDFETGSSSSANPLLDGKAIEWLLRPQLPWATGYGQRVRITTRWGWPGVPDEIHEANLLRAQRLARRKHSAEGVAANSDFGPIRVSRWDPDYDSLLFDFKRPGLG